MTSGEIEFWPAAGKKPGPVIEIERDGEWEPPEPRPWSPRLRIAATVLAVALTAGVYFAGIARPTSLDPVFVRVATAEALALDGDRAYVSGDNLVRAYSLADGAPLWSHRVVGLSTLAVLGRDRLVVSTVDVGQRPEVEVLDSVHGTVIWQRQTRFVGVAGQVIVVHGPVEGDQAPLRGLAATDGSPRWSVALEPTVMIAGNAGILLTDQVEVVPGHLRVRDLTSGKVVVDATQRADAPATSATVVGGTALVVDGLDMISAYDTNDGRWLWREPVPVVGLFSGFGDCGRYICHVNDRGTVALDRQTGRQGWKVTKRYVSEPIDEEHMFAAETFEGFHGPGTTVVDPRNGQVRSDLGGWRGLGVIDGPELLVWRSDGAKHQLIGFFDALTERTRIIGRSDGWVNPPTCVTSYWHVLCANSFDFAVWSR